MLARATSSLSKHSSVQIFGDVVIKWPFLAQPL